MATTKSLYDLAMTFFACAVFIGIGAAFRPLGWLLVVGVLGIIVTSIEIVTSHWLAIAVAFCVVLGCGFVISVILDKGLKKSKHPTTQTKPTAPGPNEFVLSEVEAPEPDYGSKTMRPLAPKEMIAKAKVRGVDTRRYSGPKDAPTTKK